MDTKKISEMATELFVQEALKLSLFKDGAASEEDLEELHTKLTKASKNVSDFWARKHPPKQVHRDPGLVQF
jgi:hypothetical protein